MGRSANTNYAARGNCQRRSEGQTDRQTGRQVGRQTGTGKRERDRHTLGFNAKRSVCRTSCTAERKEEKKRDQKHDEIKERRRASCKGEGGEVSRCGYSCVTTPSGHPSGLTLSASSQVEACVGAAIWF